MNGTGEGVGWRKAWVYLVARVQCIPGMARADGEGCMAWHVTVARKAKYLRVEGTSNLSCLYTSSRAAVLVCHQTTRADLHRVRGAPVWVWGL